MGALCSTDTADQDERNEGYDSNTYSTSREGMGDGDINMSNGSNNAESNNAAEKQKVFDKIIEIAEKKFLSNVSSRRGGASHTSDVESDPVRTRLLGTRLDPNQVSMDTPLESVLNPFDTDKYSTIIDLLNKPVEIDKYDILSDEMAALVSKHTNYIDILDTENSIVGTFSKAPISV